MVGPVRTLVAAGFEAAAAPEGVAVPWPLSMKARMSVLVTLPFLPVPGTALMSMPSFLARCLTAGVDKALDVALRLGCCC